MLLTRRPFMAALALVLAACYGTVEPGVPIGGAPPNTASGGAPGVGSGGSTTPPAAGSGGAPTPPGVGSGGSTTPPAAGSGGAPTPPGAGSGGAPVGPYLPGSVPLRRLNRAEYEATVRDWLGSKLPAFNLPEDGRADGFDTVGSALQVNEAHLLVYESAALALVEELFTSDPAGIRKAWCNFLTGAAVATCATTIVTDFAARAWRRPHASWGTNNGLPGYLALLSATGPIGTQPLETRLRAALQAVLMSPRFIYRVEFADPAGQLDTYSVASRLSYLLWSSAPDAALLATNLLDSTVLEQQLKRMQVIGQGATAAFDPRFKRFAERFPDLWLETERLPGLQRGRFPAFNTLLAADMRKETLDFFARFVGMGDNPQYPRLPISDMLTANFGMVTPRLADIYCAVDGAPGVCAIKGATGSVDLTKAASPRLGLLTQAAIMTVTASESRTAPVLRGKWILNKVLCTEPPPVPESLKEIVAAAATDNRTNITERERLAEHRATGLVCTGCHESMDAIGLGLENYDSVGMYRTRDASGKTIDATGKLPGSNAGFQNGTDLARVLGSDPRFTSCMIRQIATYATGRLLREATDNNLIADLAASAGATMSFQDALRVVVLSSAFRRRTPEVP